MLKSCATWNNFHLCKRRRICWVFLPSYSPQLLLLWRVPGSQEPIFGLCANVMEEAVICWWLICSTPSKIGEMFFWCSNTHKIHISNLRRQSLYFADSFQYSDEIFVRGPQGIVVPSFFFSLDKLLPSEINSKEYVVG